MPTTITIREAARRLGIHENTVRRYADRGLLRVKRLPSGVRRLREEDVEALAADGRLAPDQRPWSTDEIFSQPEKARTVADFLDRAPTNIWKSSEEMENFIAWTYENRRLDR